MLKIQNPKIEGEDPHRDGDKPAIICSGATEFYYKYGKLHRINGPAAVWEFGLKEWWIDGVEYTEEKHNKTVKEALSQPKDVGLADNRWWVREYYKRNMK